MAVRERTFLATPVVEASGRIIASPFQFAVTGEDNLRLSVANSAGGVVVRMDGRFLNDDGSIDSFSHSFTPTSDRLTTATLFPLSRGFVLNLTVFCGAGATRIGQTFAKVDIVRGFSGATIALGTVLQGYITDAQGLGWPGSPIQNSFEGGGYTRLLTATVPAPGNNVLETVPVGACWRVLSVLSVLTTSAALGTRTVSALGYVQHVPCYICPHPQQALPSQSITVLWAQGMALDSVIAGARTTVGIPTGMQHLAGDTIGVICDNMQAGDRFTDTFFALTEWLEVAG